MPLPPEPAVGAKPLATRAGSKDHAGERSQDEDDAQPPAPGDGLHSDQVLLEPLHVPLLLILMPVRAPRHGHSRRDQQDYMQRHVTSRCACGTYVATALRNLPFSISHVLAAVYPPFGLYAPPRIGHTL